MELISRVAAILQPPANPNRFMFVGFQEGDVVLGVMPDASDWKRTPEILAREVHAALEKPGNALNDWDPSVRVSSFYPPVNGPRICTGLLTY